MKKITVRLMDKLTLIKVGGKIVEEQETLSRLLVAFAAIPEKMVFWFVAGQRLIHDM